METSSDVNSVIVEDAGASMKKPDVLDLIDQAKGLVKTGRKLPLSNQTLVDRESLLKLLEEIRLGLPSSIKLAAQVLRRRERIINQALAEARRTLTANAETLEAEAKQHTLVKLAEKKAEDMIKQAESQVRFMLVDAEKQITVPREDTSRFLTSAKHKLGQIASLFLFRKGK
jgi:cell division septum initiation protein DivIVA